MMWLCTLLGCCVEWQRRVAELSSKLSEKEKEIAELRSHLIDLNEVIENVIESLEKMGVQVDRMREVLKEWDAQKLGD